MEKEGSFSRRKVLKTAGAGGGIAAGISLLPAQVGATERVRKIPVLATGDTVRRTESVDKDWYDHISRAREALETNGEDIMEKEGVHSAGIARREARIGGLRKQQIKIHITPGKNPEIPEEYNQIPTAKAHENRPQDTVSNCYTSKEDPVPGGIEKAVTNNGNASVCCRGFKNGNKYMIADYHSFTSDGDRCTSEDVEGRVWGQPDLSDEVGEVAYGYQNNDMALLDTSRSTRTISDTIVDESGTVVGRVTSDGLSYLKSNDIYLRKRGVNTCAETGRILETGILLGCSFSYDYTDDVVRSEPTQKPGDSGGPVYYLEPSTSNIYLAHIATQSNGSSETLGASANSMYNERGVTFGGNPYSGA